MKNLLCLIFLVCSSQAFAQVFLVTTPDGRNLNENPEEVSGYISSNENDVKPILDKFDEIQIEKHIAELNDEINNYIDTKKYIIEYDPDFRSKALLNESNLNMALNLKGKKLVNWDYYSFGNSRIKVITKDYFDFSIGFQHKDLNIDIDSAKDFSKSLG